MNRSGFAPIIILLVVVILAVGGIWYYEATRSASPAPVVSSQSTQSQNNPSTPTKSTAGTTNSNPSASATTTPTEAFKITLTNPSSTTISNGGVIEISGSGFESYNLPEGGDQYNDGIWITNGKYSANLDYFGYAFVQDDKHIQTYLPNGLCSGAETNTCPPDSEILFPAGQYSVYIKTASGTFQSNSISINVVGSVSPDLTYRNLGYILVGSNVCNNTGYSTVAYCDSALVQVDETSRQATTIIPSFWAALPELKTTPGLVNLLFADQSDIFVEPFAYGGGEGFAYNLGYYRINLQSKQFTKLSYRDGNCGSTSPDSGYIADSYTINTSTEELKVFSLLKDDDAFDFTLPPYQTTNDQFYGMSCDGPTWISTDTVEFGIYDSSKGTESNGIPQVATKTVSFPPLPQ